MTRLKVTPVVLSLRSSGGARNTVVDALRVIRDDGSTDPRLDPKLSEVDAVRIYRGMSLQRILDNRMLALQRQGRIGFYGPSLGQEAAIVGAAVAMEPEDWIVPQYREPGAALVRGMPLKELLCQLMGNAEDPVKGRQMPCHYVYRKGNYLSISSPVGTQIPHAVGIGWAMRLRGEHHAVLVFFGDGATSTADFHAAMNFAGVFRTPTVFLCNNNQWAISVPVSKQTASATLAQKAPAYGFDGVRVDGMDALAVYRATRDAAGRAREGQGPTLVEAVTYRLGPHSSSDDPSRYRDEAEVATWRARDPLVRYRRYLQHAGWWDDAREARLEQDIGDEITRAIQEAERAGPPGPETLFTDVYETMPDHIRDERDAFLAFRGR
jgi:pyruvate dehydrogenase E1 component alpha subunit